MQKFSIASSIIIITIVFIYSLDVLSNNNKCTWVRAFECGSNTSATDSWTLLGVTTSNNTDFQVSTWKYEELKTTWNMFLDFCNPSVVEDDNNYTLNYSNCKLDVSINKDQPRVSKVKVDGKTLSRDEINNMFK